MHTENGSTGMNGHAAQEANGEGATEAGTMVLMIGLSEADPNTSFPLPKCAQSAEPLRDAVRAALSALKRHREGSDPAAKAYRDLGDAVGRRFPAHMSNIAHPSNAATLGNLSRTARQIARWIESGWFDSRSKFKAAKAALRRLVTALAQVPKGSPQENDVITETVSFSVTGRRGDVDPFMRRLNQTIAVARVRETLRLAGRHRYVVSISDCGHLDITAPDGTYVGHFDSGLSRSVLQDLIERASSTARYLHGRWKNRRRSGVRSAVSADA